MHAILIYYTFCYKSQCAGNVDEHHEKTDAGEAQGQSEPALALAARPSERLTTKADPEGRFQSRW